MLAQVTHVLPLTLIRRGRLLPCVGNVLVTVGQNVIATDILAEATLPGKHYIVDVYRALGIAHSNKTIQYIERKVGEKLQKGDSIAETGGLFRRVVRSPVDGEIKVILGGQVVIELAGSPVQLLAGLSGIVAEIIPGRGAILETSGVLVQAGWGNGQINMGPLISLAETPEDELKPEQLQTSHNGSVVLSGYCSQAKVLNLASEVSLRGLILGSMSSDLIPLARKLAFPVILLEGFGTIPMNKNAFTILTTNQKRDAAINASAWDDFNGERPEVTITLPADGEPPPETDNLKEGQRVRIQGEPYPGMIGTLIRIRQESTLLSNGLRVQSADVRLEDNQQVAVPLLNLDVLE